MSRDIPEINKLVDIKHRMIKKQDQLISNVVRTTNQTFR